MIKKLFMCCLSCFFIFALNFNVKSEQNDPSKRFNIALGSLIPSTLDPSFMSSTQPIVSNVFDNLVVFNADNKLAPCLAASWNHSADGKMLEFKLRKGIKFSTGDPFTAKDVVFTVERGAKKNMSLIDQLSQGYDRIEAVDDYTVRVYFKKPNVQFLYQSTQAIYIISKDYYDRVGEDAFLKSPVGTGPYKYADWKAGQYVDLDVNDFYWDKKPQVKKARYSFVLDGNTRVNMLKTGEADMITDAPWHLVPELQNSGYHRTDILWTHMIALQFGLMNPDVPWANIKVRQAINYAIDKDILIKKTFNNIPISVGWLNEFELGYDKSLKPAYAYDLKKAKQLMAEAGYSKGFEMPIVYRNDISGGKEVTNYIASTLAQIGIECKLTAMTFGPEFMQTIRKLHADPTAKGNILWSPGIIGNPDPVINLTNGFYSVKPSGLYSRKDLDMIIDKSIQTINDKQREKLIKQAYKIIDKDLPFIPVLQITIVYMMKPNISYISTCGINSGPSTLRDVINK